MASTRQDSNLVSSYLDEERSLGRVIGPLDIEVFPIVQCSPMGLVPKGSSGKWRLIVDLSSPEGSSVNDSIDPTLCSLEYVTVDVVAKMAVQLGKGAFLSKIDIRSAYRTIPVHPDDRFLLGMCWEGRLFVDTVLPFGLWSAPKIFTAVADAVEWIARANGVGHLFHYLDDFFIGVRAITYWEHSSMCGREARTGFRHQCCGQHAVCVSSVSCDREKLSSLQTPHSMRECTCALVM